MINGAADYTICYFDKRLKTTHAHQLAASLVFYSPLQTIFWYDKPSFYHGEPEIEWFENLQTVFDDTKVLDGAPGKNITMARRQGQEWFVAAMTNNEGSEEEIPLTFLDKEKELPRLHLYGWGRKDKNKYTGEMYLSACQRFTNYEVPAETQWWSCHKTGTYRQAGNEEI